MISADKWPPPDVPWLFSSLGAQRLEGGRHREGLSSSDAHPTLSVDVSDRGGKTSGTVIDKSVKI